MLRQRLGSASKYAEEPRDILYPGTPLELGFVSGQSPAMSDRQQIAAVGREPGYLSVMLSDIV